MFSSLAGGACDSNNQGNPSPLHTLSGKSRFIFIFMASRMRNGPVRQLNALVIHVAAALDRLGHRPACDTDAAYRRRLDAMLDAEHESESEHQTQLAGDKKTEEDGKPS